MKAAIFNPYLDTLGGGERYTLSFALVLAEEGFQVDVEWKETGIRKILEERFGMNLSKINFVPDVKRGDGYDVCFWVSDGSIPLLRARKNFLHFQVPFHGVNGKTLLNKMKLFRVNKIICNSKFTKGFIDKEYGVESIVIYPPVAVDKIKPMRKENIILFVGRFSQLKQSKGQDVLIDAFKKLYDGGIKDWRLILAGGVEVGVGDYLEKLKKDANDYPIGFIESPDFKTLKGLYGKSKIFWSASGFGEDEEKNPERVEHFGITVVEAMAAGAVPIVYNAGGHKEIIQDRVEGFLWDDPTKLISVTSDLIKDPGMIREISNMTKQKAQNYSLDIFNEKISAILK